MDRPSGFLQRPPRRTFRDRREAGRVLARELASYRGKTDLLVLGLARGGVPVGWEVAAALCAELDVFLVRKLGVPQWPELAMGALASGGGVVMNDDVVSSLQISDEQVRRVIAGRPTNFTAVNAPTGAGGRRRTRAARPSIVVDDGIATGASMLAAVRAVRAGGPDVDRRCRAGGTAVGVPTAGQEADDVVCATMPEDFEAVGQVFADFRQVSDDEVRELLATPPRP